jgi:uncharacterized membrane protein
MNTNRLEAFSDGVIAVIITIMVLELKAPEEADLHAIQPLLPVFLTYVLSFVFLGIYWNNHHHMLHAAKRSNGAVLWANLHLLFWLSLVPFTTAWMGENGFQATPTAAYGVVLLGSAMAFTILAQAIGRLEGHASTFARTRSRPKELISLALYVAAIPLAFVDQRISQVIFATVAAIWLLPNRQLEAELNRLGANH